MANRNTNPEDPADEAGADVGELAGCNRAFQNFAEGATPQHRRRLWDAFRSSWLAALASRGPGERNG